MTPTFYRRPLPETLVAFASPEGRGLFQEALASGGLEGWFALAEQFHTQSDPAFCGLGTLVVALNALEIDPGRIWKGPWRWYAEELLDCCLPLEDVRTRGLTLEELACLARCNGAKGSPVHADRASVEQLRQAIVETSAAARGSIMIAAYSRRELGQTGAGHFSPIAGYHSGRDLALVMDVARFKYPPHWVPLPLLHTAMRAADPASGRARGWLVLQRNLTPIALFFRVAAGSSGAALGAALLDQLPALPPHELAGGAEALVRLFDRHLGATLRAWTTRSIDAEGAVPTEHGRLVEQLLAELRTSHAFATVRRARAGDSAAPLWDEALAMLLLALPDEILAGFPPAAAEALAGLRALPPAAASLAEEIAALREQLGTLRLWRARGSCDRDQGAPGARNITT